MANDGSSPGDTVSEIFDPSAWTAVEGFGFTDITYHRAVDTGIVRIAFDRPEIRNAFRPHTVDELYTALDHAISGFAARTATSTPKTKPPTRSSQAEPGGSTSSRYSA